MLWDESIDRDFVAGHTRGFDELKAIVREYTPRFTAELCGIDEAALLEAARWFARGPTLSLYCQGLNQSTSGTAKNAALINLHLATGQIGKPGAGPFSLTGQPNAMGGREVGGLANALSAHRDLADPVHRAEVAALWGVADVPAAAGLTAVELFDALKAGAVRMVWIACTNPAQSMPDQATVREGLARAEFVVLQEAYASTETTGFADMVLPAAGWGEKDGTVTNSERRISRVRAAVAPPAEARSDWAIAVDFARRLETRLQPHRRSLFPYASPAEVFAEHVETTRGRDLDITGLSYERLDALGPTQWPCRDGDAAGKARLYTDGKFATPDGRARFAAVAFRPVAEKVDARFPFRLTTGRCRDQWHGMTRTGTVAALFAHAPEPALELNPADLVRRDFRAGELVRVESRRGAVIVPVAGSEDVKSGCAYLPMHWGSATLAGRGSTGINAVTAKAFCPTSMQPELKHAAVRVTHARLPWSLVAFGFPARAGTLIKLRDAVRECAGEFEFASVVLIGGDSPGILLRAAAAEAIEDALLAQVDLLFGLQIDDVVRYDDAKRGIGRRVRVEAGRLAAVRLSGDVSAEGWLRDWLTSARDVAESRRLLLLPSAHAPGGYVPRGRIVCNCFDVSESEIAAQLANCAGSANVALAALQAQSRCGTNCGSCLPELTRLATASRVAA